MLRNFREKYIGDKQFYKNVLYMVIPMILQNLVTNFVSLIDNIMVGRIGTEQMNGVSIVNQYIFVFNITVFGAVAGPSIFGAQFFGKGDHEGQKYTFRYRLIAVTLITAIGAVIFGFFSEPLINLFISKEDAPERMAETLKYGKEYMLYMLLGLIPFGIGQAYSSVVRECGETRIPMIGSMAAVVFNVFLDYALIFGKFGFPEMGVKGAAIATVAAKFIEALVVIAWTHAKPEKNKYIVGVFRRFTIPRELV
ncbi:MAG: MATE family efflux transporter, partial [Ruminococcus sp.]|nr:MATE family efflux transporter [Ruminococcus sp.]